MTQDFTGREVEAGDVVVFTGGGKARLLIARIEHTNPKSFYLHEISEAALKATYEPVSELIPSRRVTLLSDQMRHLDDVEVHMHFERLRKGNR